MSLTASNLLLPSPDAAWQLWKARTAKASESVESPAELRQSSGPLVIGLPATACRSLGLQLPMAEHELLHQMVETHLERQGLRTAEGDLRPHRWHLLGQAAGMALISVDVLADPFPDHLVVEQANDYLAALRLLELPEHHLVIIEEQGDLILAASVHGRLFRSHVFAPAGASPEEVAQEVQISRLALEALPGFAPLTGITLVGRGWEADRIADLCGLPARVVEALPRASQLEAAPTQALLPQRVRDLRARKLRAAKALRWTVLGGLLYVSLIFLGFAYLRFHERSTAQLQQQVDATTTPASAVRQAAEAWRSLAPAVDSSRYPMVLLAEITRLMPPSGIMLEEFEGRIGDIEIRGQTRDAQLAYQFLEDLQKHRILSRYTWSMPQPTVREKVASFRAQGKLK